MNRFDHMILATVAFAVIWLVMKYLQAVIPVLQVMPDTVGFWFIFVGWLGAMFPDFDHDWKPFMGHRAWITHSFVMPLIFVAAVWLPLRWIFSGDLVALLGGDITALTVGNVGASIWGVVWWAGVDRYFIAIFFTGVACHLFTDLIPSTKSILNRFSKSPKEGIAYIERSLVSAPGNITKVPEPLERPWLIGNGIILIIFAIIIWWSPWF